MYIGSNYRFIDLVDYLESASIWALKKTKTYWLTLINLLQVVPVW